jgi:DNA polymerase-3 subunit beta
MKIELTREALLAPLHQIAGVVEKRQTLPVLSNVLLEVEDGVMRLTTSDLEVEMSSQAPLESYEPGRTTVPARKLLDIVRSLPDGQLVQIQQAEDRVVLRSGKSRFTLATLDAHGFPRIEEMDQAQELHLAQSALRYVIQRVSFAMAHQDVRYFLNGMLLQIGRGRVRGVATDGHRLATAEQVINVEGDEQYSVIVPRKGVVELGKMVEESDEPVQLWLTRNHIRIRCGNHSMTSKLIDGRYPDYEAVIPVGADKRMVADIATLRKALQRTAILTSDKFRGVRLEVDRGELKLTAHNPEQEEAVEEISVDYDGPALKLGFNISYLIDAIDALDGPELVMSMRDGDSSCLITDVDNDQARHVVMPLKL